METYLSRVSKRCFLCGSVFGVLFLFMLLPIYFNRDCSEVLHLNISIMAGFFTMFFAFGALGLVLVPDPFLKKTNDGNGQQEKQLQTIKPLKKHIKTSANVNPDPLGK